MIQGFRRDAFSNEPRIGSAAIAHSAVRTAEPITERLVALWEPFIDAVVICTMIALVIVITGMYQQEGIDGVVALTSMAYASVLPWFPYLLTAAVFMSRSRPCWPGPTTERNPPVTCSASPGALRLHTSCCYACSS